MNETSPSIPVTPTRAGSAKPAGYTTSLLLITGVLVLSQIAGETLLAMRHSEETAGARTLVLLGIGGAALLGLILVNARWLWATLGNLRWTLALITVWAVSAVLGTLVVQRTPGQSDSGYARTFLEATGDFFYDATHIGGGVVVHPTADVERWFADQERIFGAEQGEEIREEWMRAETGRLKGEEIRAWTAAHDGLLREVLAVVSWLRLPDSVWFPALLGLLCTSLVIMVIQRWRGEWRQIGWAMAHLGLVVLCIGALVRATTRVDGCLSMTVGDTKAHYARKVDPDLAARDPNVQFDDAGNAFLTTPLDFELRLERFKTEYPRHLFVTFPEDGAQKSWPMSEDWKHGFLAGHLDLRVARLQPDVVTRMVHGESPDGPPRPALRMLLTAAAERDTEEVLLLDRRATGPSEGAYLVQYRRASDEADHDRLVSTLGGFGAVAVDVGGEAAGVLAEADVGNTFAVPGMPGLQARVSAVWPDWPSRDAPDGRLADLRDPAVELDLLRDGAPVGRVVALSDRMIDGDGAGLAQELRFDVDQFPFRHKVPVRYRLVDLPGRAPTLVVFRGDVVAEARELAPGDAFALGDGGAQMRYEQSFERHTGVVHTEPAAPDGRTPEDMDYASLPTELVLEARGGALTPLIDLLGLIVSSTRKPPAFGGLVLPADFAAGDGQVTLSSDGRGLLLRLVSDDRELAGFPSATLGAVMAYQGQTLPFRLAWVTNDRAPALRFASDVSLLRDGKVIKRALVEPNQPLELAGFRFSQLEVKQENSGFGVVRDPSVRIVYFGMGILVVGVILLSSVNPIVAARRSRKAA